MSQIRTLFSSRRQLDRRIEKVIDYAALGQERLLAEAEEYEATDNVEACFEKFLENYRRGVEGHEVAEIGVWVSGFYGSGKSSFTKYLGLALENLQIGEHAFLDLLAERLQSVQLKALLKTTAAKDPAIVVFLDLGSEMLAENAAAPVSTVLYWKVLQLAGYSREKKLAQLELTLRRRGKLDEFKRHFRERWKEEWENVHNDLLIGNARAAQVIPTILPDEFPTPESFSKLKFDEAASIRDRAKEMVELLRDKFGARNILFLIDEAGQYVAPREELILNLDGLVRDFKELGEGKVWVVATGQQTLTEIVSRALYNSGELYKLQARFPITIELDARDIKEITYRRLLTKSAEGEAQLKALFRSSGQALVARTRLEGTTLYRGDPDADAFARFYPFLPQHFDLLLESIRALARSAGAVGLRSAIKVIQDVLVDVNHLLPAGATKLADRPVGALACADDFYDILRADILKVLPHVVQAIDRVTRKWGAQAIETRVAKAVGVLQVIEGLLPASTENVAALLYTQADTPSLVPEVRQAVQNLAGEPAVGLVEDPKVGGFIFLSDKVVPYQKKRSQINLTSGDLNRIRSEILGKIFDPQPSARLEGTKEVKASVRSGRGLIAGDSEEISFRLEWVDDAGWNERREKLLTDTSHQGDWQNALAWLARNDDTVEEILPEISRSEQIALQINERDADRDVAQFLRAERKRAETGREEVEKAFRGALMGGTLIFRGRPTPVSSAGQTIEAAAREVLGQAAKEVFRYYHLAPIRATTDLAFKFLSVDRLDRIVVEQDPLRLVSRVRGAPGIDTTKDVLDETLRAFQAKLDEAGAGRLQGNFIQDLFSSPPYGWSKDTVRYLFAALLRAGEVVWHTADGTLKTAGPKAAEACKSTVAFNKIGVSRREGKITPEERDLAARRLQEVFGTDVLPLEENISQAVRVHIPTLYSNISALPDQLRLLGLPGEARASKLKDDLTSSLSADAANAVAIWSVKDSSLPADIRWAQAILRAFEEGAEVQVRQANRLREGVEEIDRLFPGEGRCLLTEAEAQSLAEALASELFYEQLGNVRGLLRSAQERAGSRLAQVQEELNATAEAISANLEAQPDWPLLSDEDRDALIRHLKAQVTIRPSADPLNDLKTALVRKSALANVERELLIKLVRLAPQAPPPDITQPPEVAAISLVELTPSDTITTEVQLDTWLNGLRVRLVRLLRENKHIRIG